MRIATGAGAVARFITRMHDMVGRGEFTLTLSTGTALIEGRGPRLIVVLSLGDLNVALTHGDAYWLAHQVALKAKAELETDWQRAGLYAGIADSLLSVLQNETPKDKPTVH